MFSYFSNIWFFRTRFLNLILNNYLLSKTNLKNVFDNKYWLKTQNDWNKSQSFCLRWYNLLPPPLAGASVSLVSVPISFEFLCVHERDARASGNLKLRSLFYAFKFIANVRDLFINMFCFFKHNNSTHKKNNFIDLILNV